MYAPLNSHYIDLDKADNYFSQPMLDRSESTAGAALRVIRQAGCPGCAPP